MVSSSVGTCAQCLQKRPEFERCHSAWNYEFPINHLIQKIKYQKQLAFLPPLAKHLALVLQHKYDGSPWPQAVIPIPLHSKRLRSRGFDQSLLLAKALTKALKPEHAIDINCQLIQRVQQTTPQQSLKASERRKNIRGAFQVTRKTPLYHHIALVDDVVTTGETVSEAARVLKNSGVTTVDVWCLARTPP